MISKRNLIGVRRGDVIRTLKQPQQTTTINPLRPMTMRTNHLSDAEGLKRAYQEPNHIFKIIIECI